jgi:hypothetical protein
MRWVKIGALLALVLVAMRVASWALGWLLRRVRVGPRTSAVVANLAAFGLFSILIWWNLAPGEPMDLDALLFGLVVFGAYGAIDGYRARPHR